MKYSVNDVSQLLGITPGAIHFFEKANLIEAERNSKGHRFYDNEDIFRLLSYAKYRSMGFPIKTIVKQFSGHENDKKLIYERLARHQEEARLKAKYYHEIEEEIGEHLNCSLQIERLHGQYEFDKSPNVLIMNTDELGWISKNKNSQSAAQKWVKAMPTTRLVIKLNSISTMDARFGYSVAPHKAKELSLPIDANTEEMPRLSCMHTITTTDETFADKPQVVFEEALAYARSRGFEIYGKPWGRILLVEAALNVKLKIYIELWLPIK